MSWLFSRALVEEYSAASCLDGEPSAPLNVMPTAHKFWRRGKTIDVSNLSLFGLTCAVLTDDHGQDVLTSFLEAFPVRTSAQPVRGPGSPEIGQVYGKKWRGSSVKFDPVSYSWRIAQPSLLEDSEPFLGTWPQWGLMRDGVCLELQTAVSRIGGTESGFSLPTPSGVNGGRNHTMGRIDEWGGSSNPLRGTVLGSMCLPEFEELVMGWPIGWTELTPFATDRFQEWQQQHSDF